MDSPQVLDPSDDAPVQLPQSQDGDTSDLHEDASHGVVGMVPGSDGKTRPRRPRGRHAKDPLAKSIVIQCQRLEDLEAQLKEHLADPATDREHTTLEFDFPVTAAFMVAAREPLGKGDLGEKRTPYTYSLFNKTAITVIDALHTIEDPKERVIMQKGISKTLVETCQNVDGYRYSFHNHWISREDQASRFSYYCNDSVLNKGRAANEGVSKIKAGVKVRKPVYDCHGLISIKFSVTKNKMELHYKHIPLHKTFEERAPNPRNGSKRKRLLEIFHPEKLPKHKRRKSDESKPPRPKRSATEPVPQADDGSTAPQRENSLAPLFDFLGRLEEDESGPDTTEPPTTDVVKDPGPESGNRRKKKTVPGTFIWNIADSQKRKPAPKRSQTALVVTATLAAPSATAAPADVIPPSGGLTVTSVSSTELELRARLEQAEQKIRDLEAEKQQPARVPTDPGRSSALPEVPQGPRPPPLATAYPSLPPNTYFPPPHFPYPSASLQWSYTPHPYHYPYPYPPGGSSSLPFPNPSPGTAPGATHPDAYHYHSQPLPPLGQQRPRSNPSPTYGFVPSPIDPMDPVTMRVRSYLGPSQPHTIPDSSSVSRVEPRAETQATAQSTQSPSQRQTERSSRAPSAPAPEPSDRNATAPEPSDGSASVPAIAELAKSEARAATPVPAATSTTPGSRAAVPDPNSTEPPAGTEQDSSTVVTLSTS